MLFNNIDNLLEEVNLLIRLPLNENYLTQMRSFAQMTEFLDAEAYKKGKNSIKLLYIMRIAMELAVKDPIYWNFSRPDEKCKSDW